uniref:Proteasome subunit beta n=1 Tax=Noctiluca scintillans TaxID=2966 RepID=A0A7S1A9S0_NOCSC|mmetsp:Transcript_37617/g.100052  ORF Transcript_37617/g.100052 Transcript_37617/m.100052 type:complete len:240 (+) Transcript_37617:67-786(+)|eukprot:CAMPEP_0194504518 /NCGR_PEP_ID=MMETSP0253-20130528/28990_1 /TAXON_ID=2966 /ORGANISM="Noctiluca scintillans" /LENGTH=239 /DNA_ID=CAMNT_0039346917 /DNA_START=66 /DNA_END=785 /DNA_ORIENTATION=+
MMLMPGLQPAAEARDFVKHVEPDCPYREDDVMSPEAAVSTGTTILAVKFSGGVVLCADSRTSTGDYVANRASRKISKVTDRICVLRSGSAADTQALTQYVAHYLSIHEMDIGTMPTVKTCATLFKELAYGNKDRLLAGLIVAGWDKRGGQVFEIPLGGTLMPISGFSIGGSGSGFIYGLCDATYKPEMTKDECVEWAKKMVSHAMSRDGSSGGMIRVVTIDEGGIEEFAFEGNKLPFGP